MLSKSEEAKSDQEQPTRAAPPAYRTQEDTPSQLVSSFASLKLSSNPAELDVDTCLAHLKLLFAFQSLKEEVGNHDGLFGIWEGRCIDNEVIKRKDGTEETKTKQAQPAKAREKRWALYVARAADRFETWWSKSLAKFEDDPKELSEEDMMDPEFAHFPLVGKIILWEPKDLPPLDVLMIWHSYMLNPRDFLEDCVRANYKNVWATGMPWREVNDAITTTFNYVPGPEAEANFTELTGRPWSSLEEPPTKRVACPYCSTGSDVAWSTCGEGADPTNPKSSTLIGQGYADGDFKHICPSCGMHVDFEILRVAKLKKDVEKYLNSRNVALPGTILDMKTGSPTAVPKDKVDSFEQTFPARMIKKALRSEILDLVKPGEKKPEMQLVKRMVEGIFTSSDTKRAAEIDGRTGRLQAKTYKIPGPARVHTRIFLSRYLDSHSPFAIDLAAAAIRQGVFTEKMVKINWLHSPDSRATIQQKCITKYTRYVRIIAENPGQLVVPTLDVDLAWHTHQLSPRSYYVYTVSKTKTFINHDDKVRDETLAEAFEFTSNAYQEMFKEVYSECVCWYCEAVRLSNLKGPGKIFGLTSAEKLNDSFHKSLPSAAADVSTTAHISNHNAVRVKEDILSIRNAARAKALHRQLLEEAYQKACKQAKKRKRVIPKRELYYDHWGATFAVYSPFMYPVMAYPGLYQGGKDAGTAYGGDSLTGSCAIGTCGSGPKNAECYSGASCTGAGMQWAFAAG